MDRLVSFLSGIVCALWAAVFSRYIARQGREGELSIAAAMGLPSKIYCIREKAALFPGTSFSRN